MPSLGSMRSNMTRKKTSSQVSSACMAIPAASASLSALPTVASRSTPAWRWNAAATVSLSGSAVGSQTCLLQRSSGTPVSASSAAQSCMIAS